MNVPLYPEFYSGNRASSKKERMFFNVIRKIGQSGSLIAAAIEAGKPEQEAKAETMALLNHLAGPERELLNHILAKDSRDITQCAKLAQKFQESPDKVIHYVNKTFIDFLVDDPVVVREEMMPKDGFIAYFAMESGSLQAHGEEWLVGAYSRIYREGEHMFIDGALVSKSLERRYWCKQCQMYHTADMTFFNDLATRMSLTIGASVDDYINQGMDEQLKIAALEEDAEGVEVIKHNRERFKRATQFLVKCTLHLHSERAYLLTLPLISTQSSREQKEQRDMGFFLNNSKYPIVLVNWNYVDGEYDEPATKGDTSEDSTSGHERDR